MNDQWLVRTSKNVLAGPYSREQVIQLIRDGQLTHEDEVCQASHYWIFLHEHEEVVKQLGIELPRALKGADEEDTQTETALTEPGFQAPDLGQMDGSEHTTAIVRSPRPQAQPQTQAQPVAAMAAASSHPAPAMQSHTPAPSHSYPPRPQVGGHSGVMIEKPSIWRGFAWLLIVIACAILYVVLRKLKMPQGG